MVIRGVGGVAGREPHRMAMADNLVYDTASQEGERFPQVALSIRP